MEDQETKELFKEYIKDKSAFLEWKQVAKGRSVDSPSSSVESEESESTTESGSGKERYLNDKESGRCTGMVRDRGEGKLK